ncbi:MAG: hypothetical protein ACXW1T_10480 [Methylophilus sp.]
MKVTKIALACGLAVAAMSAHAAGPTIPAGAKTVFVSGASAPDGFLGDIAVSMLAGTAAGAGTPVAARTADSNYRAYVGYSKVAGQVGSPIVFIKRSAGGSAFGVDPVAKAQRVVTIDLNNCATNAGADAATFAWVCGTKGIDPGVAGADTAANNGLVPDVGVSDVEPAMFQTPFNTENGQPALSAAEVARLSNKPVNLAMFGIVATDAVPATYHLSRSAYGAMLSGAAQDWSLVDSADVDPVVVCRRVNGSGTQASYNWFFSGFPCNKASNGYASAKPASATDSFGYLGGAGTAASPIVIDPSAGYTVVENSGSGDVRNCLKAAQAGTDFTVTGSFGKVYKVLFSNVGGPSKAIGVLSLDSYTKAGAGFGYTFRQLDGAGVFDGVSQTVTAGPGTGVSPSKQNLLNGKYDFALELSMQVRNVAVTNAQGDAVAPISTDAVKNAFYTAFVKNAGSTKYTGNDGGSFTTVPNAFATLPSIDSYSAKPNFVTKYSRDGNTCQPLVAKPSL